MYCPKCGTKNDEEVNFCKGCGADIRMKTTTELNQTNMVGNAETLNGSQKQKKYVKIIAITNIVLGAILFLLSLGSEEEWTYAQLYLGMGICITGILQLLKNKQKAIAILQIIFGSLCAMVSIEVIYDWEIIGLFAGIGMLVVGILGILRKSLKVISIVEIVFGGFSILLGIECIDFAWGDTGIFFGVAFLVEGILGLISEKTKDELRYDYGNGKKY